MIRMEYNISDMERKVIDIVKGIETAKGTRRGAPWELIVQEWDGDKEELDSIIMELINAGILYEPYIGNIHVT